MDDLKVYKRVYKNFLYLKSLSRKRFSSALLAPAGLAAFPAAGLAAAGLVSAAPAAAVVEPVVAAVPRSATAASRADLNS